MVVTGAGLFSKVLGASRAPLRLFSKPKVTEVVHNGELGGEVFAVSCLQLLDKKLYHGVINFLERLQHW